MQETESIMVFLVQTEKSVPWNNCSASFDKPRDAEQFSWEIFSSLHLISMNTSYIFTDHIKKSVVFAGNIIFYLAHPILHGIEVKRKLLCSRSVRWLYRASLSLLLLMSSRRDKRRQLSRWRSSTYHMSKRKLRLKLMKRSTNTGN